MQHEGEEGGPPKGTPKEGGPQKGRRQKGNPQSPKESATKKQAVLRDPKKSENLLASVEVCRKFTMTVQVSGHEYLADPVAATRRVLIFALTKIPAKIHEEQVDSGNIDNGMFNNRADIHFNGVLTTQRTPQAPICTPPTYGNGSRPTVREGALKRARRGVSSA